MENKKINRENLTASSVKLFDVIFVRNTTLIGRIIRFVTRFKYNHVLLVVEYMGEKYVADATSKGFFPRMMLTKWLLQKKSAKIKIAIARENRIDKITLPARSKRMRRIRMLTGARYDKFSLAFFHLINQLTGKYLGGKSLEKVVCSEAIAYVYREFFPEYWKATPKEIYDNKHLNIVFEGYANIKL